MEQRFVPVAFPVIEAAVRKHLASLPAATDSFLEDHILTSAHYQIIVAGEIAGFASIHEDQLITQFALDAPFRRYGQPLFATLRHLEQVQAAFVPTYDGFFLAHALDDYRQLAKQAYFFATPRDAPPPKVTGHDALRPATVADATSIRELSGDLFGDIDARLERRELYVTERRGEPVGFGVMQRSELLEDVASIGMFTIERFRRDGVGTATIALLIGECQRLGLRPVAGCWYYNHRSKRTIERAGMYTATRLLKVGF